MFFPDEPVPLEVVRDLAALLATNGLSELTLESKDADNALRLSLGRETLVYAAPVAPATAASVSAPVEAGDAALSLEEMTQEPTTLGGTAHEVGSPCVGIYRAPKKPLQVGDSVKSGQVIAVVESLRVPNDVIAPFDGKVVEMPVREGEGVEWGQTLLILERVVATPADEMGW